MQTDDSSGSNVLFLFSSFFTRLLLAELQSISQTVLVGHQLRIKLSYKELARRTCLDVAHTITLLDRLQLQQYREAWHTPSD